MRNCGFASNIELISICNNYDDINSDENYQHEENPIVNIVSNLSRTQRDVINSFILVNTNSLTNRNQNAIKYFLKDDLKIKNFANNILLFKTFQVKKIKNVGSGSIHELEIYIKKIKDFLIEVSENDNEKQLISLKNNFLIQTTYGLKEIPNKILESESIFQLTNFLIDQNALFDKNQALIFKKAFEIYQDYNELSIDEISNELGLTRERVRQIRLKCFDDLFDKLLFLQNFNDDLYQKYNIDIEQNNIDVNEELIEIINNYNEIKFSNKFITYLLYVYLSDKFSLVGNQEDVFFFKSFTSRNRHNWINLYLVKKKLVTGFDFISFTDDISRRMDEKIEETYNFNFKSYLSRFLRNEEISLLNEIIPIAEKLINSEFEIYIDLEDNIIFKKNTAKQVHEFAFEALEKLGKQSKLSEICKMVLILNPNYETDEGSLKASMLRKNGFVSIGRTSVYGLKKWEKEIDNFKGGTIRKIAEEYLANCDCPQHISKIAENIFIYRPRTNEKSIYYNLKLDESKIFIFFQDSHVGLVSKNYSKIFKVLVNYKTSDKRTWEESYKLLSDFIKTEKRFPRSLNCSENEQRMYNWFSVQKVKKNALDAEKIKLIDEIDETFKETRRTRRPNSVQKYNELKDFVKINFRLPSAIKAGEENLYQFFYKQRKLFEAAELTRENEINFIEIAKILQNIKHENKRN